MESLPRTDDVPSRGIFVVYADGACSGNPGPGGWGVALRTGTDQVVELGGFHPATTNNRMEMTACIEALRYLSSLSQKITEIRLCSDSQYVIKGMTEWIYGWKSRSWSTSQGKPVLNQDLWLELDVLCANLKGKLHWKYVPGHKGIPGNERADAIARQFAKNERAVDLYCGPQEVYEGIHGTKVFG